jgi:hypothetical protein
MGGGITIRNETPIGDGQTTDDQTTDDQDVEATEDRMPDLTIGGGFGTDVSH